MLGGEEGELGHVERYGKRAVCGVDLWMRWRSSEDRGLAGVRDSSVGDQEKESKVWVEESKSESESESSDSS